jgi:hypothetical protein
VAGAPGRPRSPGEEAERRRFFRVRALYLVLGLLVLGFLALKGMDYYPLSRPERELSPLHQALNPTGSWGHGVGLFATALMLSTFLHLVRKRVRGLNGVGDIRGWLDFHVFVGFLCPLVVVFHAAFQMNSHLSDWSYAALAVVVATGVVGRYIYGLVPAHHGDRFDELEDLAADFERWRAFAAPEMTEVAGGAAILRRATAPVGSGSLLLLLLRLPFETLSLRVRLRWLKRRLTFPEHYRDLRTALVKLARLRWQLRFYKSFKKLLRGWRLFHATTAVFLVLALAAHIGIATYLGYGLR